MQLVLTHGRSIFGTLRLASRNVTGSRRGARCWFPLSLLPPQTDPNQAEPYKVLASRGGKRAQKNHTKAVLIKPDEFLFMIFATFFFKFLFNY